tara:strand:+ start:193 stop:819 length:627 start_codon:yes stop_codon:yes gene_type:complete
MINNYMIKVCGITDEQNFSELKKYPIDFFGFIFYDKSPRYIFNNPDHSFIKNINNKVAVFVNEEIDKVLSVLETYNFSYVQLHGNEDNDYCIKLKKRGIKIIKSYLIRTQEDLKSIKMELDAVDYILFDYKGDNYGGSGKTFDWKILNNKVYYKPFFLSGGLSLDNINNIKLIDDNKMPYCLDLNSKFEKSPGIKDVKKISKLFNLNL